MIRSKGLQVVVETAGAIHTRVAESGRERRGDDKAMGFVASAKGYPIGVDIGVARAGEQGWNLLRDLPLPAAALRESALQHNLDWMQNFVSARGAWLAPHAKTTMCPELVKMQLARGAWGVTVSSPFQANVFRQAGIKRIFIANQVVSSPSTAPLFDWLTADPDLELYCLVDSRAGLEMLISSAQEAGSNGRLNVLVELGMEGGRTGCRTASEALALAAAVSASDELIFAGIEGFEGLSVFDGGDERGEFTRIYLARLIDLFEACQDQRLFDIPRPIISAGGSAHYDIVADVVGKAGGQLLLRSGCYITHDHGVYANNQRHVLARTGLPQGLSGALEVWSHVQSLPEPGLAILTMGKRDVGSDAGLPNPIKHWSASDGKLVRIDDQELRLEALNDQHAYMQVPRNHKLQIGDGIGVGVSHPCTTFDKWRRLFLVDDKYNITGAVETFF
jgi:D-serine dehydratase